MIPNIQEFYNEIYKQLPSNVKSDMEHIESTLQKYATYALPTLFKKIQNYSFDNTLKMNNMYFKLLFDIKDQKGSLTYSFNAKNTNMYMCFKSIDIEFSAGNNCTITIAKNIKKKTEVYDVFSFRINRNILDVTIKEEVFDFTNKLTDKEVDILVFLLKEDCYKNKKQENRDLLQLTFDYNNFEENSLIEGSLTLLENMNSIIKQPATYLLKENKICI